MMRERVANGFLALMFATLILGGIPMIPVESSFISYAATASNADRASPDGVTEGDMSSNGVYVATDAEAIDISHLENISLYGIEQDATVDSIAVRVPAMIKMDSYSTSVDFQIEIAGSLNENSVVMVMADEAVVLESVYKESINGVVNQDKDYIESTDLENGPATINGNITLDRGVSAGEWKGSFNIEVWMEKITEKATYSIIKNGSDEKIEVATPSNAERVEETTEQISNSTEIEFVEQPEEIIEEKTEISELVEDTTTSEIVENDSVISETEAEIGESSTLENAEDVLDESVEENIVEESESPEATSEMEMVEDMGSETEVNVLETEINVATPSNATRM